MYHEEIEYDTEDVSCAFDDTRAPPLRFSCQLCQKCQYIFQEVSV